MKFKHCSLIFALTVLLCQNAFASDISVEPNKENIIINQEGTSISAEMGSYLYEDYNYYRLRDVCGLIGYDVEWDNTIGIINVKRSDSGTIEVFDIPKAENVVSAKCEIELENGKKKVFDCLNIDGYNYFKLRDLADFIGFGCDWDGENILITMTETYPEEKPMRFSLNYINEDIRQEIVDGKGIRFSKDSDDYTDIEKYIQENIDKDFSIGDYIVTLTDNTQLEGIYTLTIRLNVNGIPANFGYRVICEDGYAKIINFNGEMNPNFDAAELPEKLISDEEAKARAIADNDSKYTVVGQKVSRYFDMESLKFVCSVETEYMDKGGATVVKENKYFE